MFAVVACNLRSVEMFAYYSTKDFLSAHGVQTHRVCSYQAEEKKMLIYFSQPILLKASPKIIQYNMQ
jgi:hypothetical protein